MGCATSSSVVLAQSTGGKTIEARKSIYEAFKLGERLGEGAYGRVYALRQVSAGVGDKLAVKVTDLRKPSRNGNQKHEIDQDRRRRADKEARLLKLFQNQAHIIEFKGRQMESGIHYILMEKCHYGFKQVLEQANLNETFYSCVFIQMLEALEVIDGLNVVHRDIKPHNFLFTQDLTVKLCDFGLAERLPSRRSKTFGSNGTPPYMSPEMVNAVGYNTKTDIWSFGVTAYLLLYGTFPYMPEQSGEREMKKTIGFGYPAPTFRPSQMCDGINVSDSAGNFLRLLLQREPRRRPSAKDALKHQWLALASSTTTSSLPSLRPMLVSAQEIGAFGPQRGVVLAMPDELDDYLAVQQQIYQAQRQNAVAKSKSSSGASVYGVVPSQQMNVPGAITESTLSNLNDSN